MTPHSRDCRSKEDNETHLRIHNNLRLNLPNELLIEVFKICVLKPIIIPSPHCETTFPWTLFRVSQKWRSIAQAMPELWSNVLVNYKGMDSTGESLMYADEITELTRRILLRSKNVLLSLKIVSSSIWMRNQTPLINLILNHAHRIQYLELKIFKEALRDLLLSEPIIFKCLEFLSLSSFEDIDHIDSIFFQEAPRLKVAELDIYLELSMTQYLPWGNLEHLSETNSCYLTPFGAHEVIRHCPNIITFQVALPSEEEPTDSILPVTAPYMKMLLVESPQSSEMAKFLRSLVLPYLTRLELRSPDKESIFAAFQNYAPLFLEICRFHQVKNLKIALPIPNPCNLALFLESISYVLNLELPLLSNLTLLLLSSPLVLPKLQTLRVPITPESLDTHLVLLDRRAEGHLNTPGLVLCSSSGNTIELRGCNGNENFYRNLAITELSQNISIKETCSQMRDFVPYHLKPQ